MKNDNSSDRLARLLKLKESVGNGKNNLTSEELKSIGIRVQKRNFKRGIGGGITPQ